VTVTPAGSSDPSVDLHAYCEGCRMVATPDISVVWINLRDALAAADNPHRVDAHPYDDPTLANWHISHVKCVPEDAHPYYDLDLDILIQPGRLDEHTRHLSSKRWLAHTDWHALVATAKSGRLSPAAERAA